MTSNEFYPLSRGVTASFIVVGATVITLLAPARSDAAAPWDAHGRLRVTPDGHYLQHEDGTPFFWLADTAWKLRSLSKPDIDVYLKDRAARQFNVVMFNVADPAGRDQAFLGGRPLDAVRFTESWWAHNDYIVDQAARHGLYAVVIAGWGDYLRGLFTDMPRGMHEYGTQLGLRYKDRPNVIYFVSGEFYKIRQRYDGKPLSADQEHWFNQLGDGIRSADAGHLISIHGFPDKGVVGQPSTYFQDEDWCDFYAVQTHNFQQQIRASIMRDWNLTGPTKPTVNAEGGYENCNVQLHRWLKNKSSVALFDSGWGQRLQAYWSVFHGGFGFAYGNDYLWDMTDPQGNSGVLYRPALDAPGARSMRHVRSLLENRITSAVPDQSLIVSDPGTDAGGDTTDPPDLRCATRDRNGTWAMVYTTVGKGFTIDMAKLQGAVIQARWYDPREGTYQEIGRFPATGTRNFDPPGPTGKECDWVLVLEAATRLVGESSG